jgi:hypothetical protein
MVLSDLDDLVSDYPDNPENHLHNVDEFGAFNKQQNDNYRGEFKKKWDGNSNFKGKKESNWFKNENGKWQKKPDPEDLDFTLYKPYALLLDNKTPEDVIARVATVIKKLEKQGYTLRTSINSPILKGLEAQVTRKEIYLPWKDFENHTSELCWSTPRSDAIAQQAQPAYNSLNKGVKKILSMNARVICGNKMVSPCLFLLTWSLDGAENEGNVRSTTGFMGHPITIASRLGVPVINLKHENAEGRIDVLSTWPPEENKRPQEDHSDDVPF